MAIDTITTQGQNASMFHGEHLNHLCTKGNLNVLDCFEYKLAKFFVKYIKIDGLPESAARFIKMMLTVFLHVSKITGYTKITDVAEL